MLELIQDCPTDQPYDACYTVIDQKGGFFHFSKKLIMKQLILLFEQTTQHSWQHWQNRQGRKSWCNVYLYSQNIMSLSTYKRIQDYHRFWYIRYSINLDLQLTVVCLWWKSVASPLAHPRISTSGIHWRWFKNWLPNTKMQKLGGLTFKHQSICDICRSKMDLLYEFCVSNQMAGGRVWGKGRRRLLHLHILLSGNNFAPSHLYI